MRRTLALLVALLVSLVVWPAAAHPLAPVGVHVSEHDGGRVTVTTAAPAPLATVITVAVDADCTPQGAARTSGEERVETTRDLRCAAPLTGALVHVGGLTGKRGAVLSTTTSSGQRHDALLDAAKPQARVPTTASSWRTLRRHVGLGATHLFEGLDHLLFIIGLCAIARRARRTAIALTAFTVGHSVTLAAAALGVVSLPDRLVEVGIAASLVALALAVVHPPEERRLERLWLTALAFGLLHGLGFAGALGELGLPRHALLESLFGFNLGVELGQLAVAFAALGVSRLAPLRGKRRLVVGYALGSVAAMWCVERMLF